MSEKINEQEWFRKLVSLAPYTKDPAEIVAGLQWYKVVDKNGVPLINYSLAEDKAEFICQCVNSFKMLFDACVSSLDKFRLMYDKIEDGYDEEDLYTDSKTWPLTTLRLAITCASTKQPNKTKSTL